MLLFSVATCASTSFKWFAHCVTLYCAERRSAKLRRCLAVASLPSAVARWTSSECGAWTPSSSKKGSSNKVARRSQPPFVSRVSISSLAASLVCCTALSHCADGSQWHLGLGVESFLSTKRAIGWLELSICCWELVSIPSCGRTKFILNFTFASSNVTILIRKTKKIRASTDVQNQNRNDKQTDDRYKTVSRLKWVPIRDRCLFYGLLYSRSWFFRIYDSQVLL